MPFQFCSLEEVGGVGAEPPHKLRLPLPSESDFAVKWHRRQRGQETCFLLLVVGKAMPRQKYRLSRVKGGDLRQQILPDLDRLDRCNGRQSETSLVYGFWYWCRVTGFLCLTRATKSLFPHLNHTFSLCLCVTN